MDTQDFQATRQFVLGKMLPYVSLRWTLNESERSYSQILGVLSFVPESTMVRVSRVRDLWPPR